jgi:phospholipase A1
VRSQSCAQLLPLCAALALLTHEAAAEVAAPGSMAEPGRPETAESDAARGAAPAPDILTFHRATYFLTGFTDETQVKFQFSIKFDLWPSSSSHTAYFAYTQVSLWDIYDESQPFRESNYAPEAFYAHYHSKVRDEPDPGCGLFAEQAGIEHESNGESSAASRSWNRIFGNVEFTCYGDPLYALSGLRLWYPLAAAENADIVKTQGYGELVLGAGFDDVDSHMNSLVTVTLRKGMSRDWAKGNVTVDARWRPTYRRVLGPAWKFAPFIWLQFFTGYGETLADFDRPAQSFRVGVGFTDRTR